MTVTPVQYAILKEAAATGDVTVTRDTARTVNSCARNGWLGMREGKEIAPGLRAVVYVLTPLGEHRLKVEESRRDKARVPRGIHFFAGAASGNTVWSSCGRRTHRSKTSTDAREITCKKCLTNLKTAMLTPRTLHRHNGVSLTMEPNPAPMEGADEPYVAAQPISDERLRQLRLWLVRPELVAGPNNDDLAALIARLDESEGQRMKRRNSRKLAA